MSLIQRSRAGCHVCGLFSFFRNCVFPPPAVRLSPEPGRRARDQNKQPPLSPPQADVQGLPTSPRPSGKATSSVCVFFFYFFLFCFSRERPPLAGKMSCIFSAGCAEMLNGRPRRRARASARRRSSCSDSRLMRHLARLLLRCSARLQRCK